MPPHPEVEQPHGVDAVRPDRGGMPPHTEAGVSLKGIHPDLEAVLEAAARLQELVPDAVLVGGSAAALYAHHRLSYNHDHVVKDLRDRFDIVLEAIESAPGWVTNRVTPGKIVLGEIGDIEAGVRQLIRTTPLETHQVTLRSGRSVTVPTADETLRVKAFLIVRRNQVRDYIDVAALSDTYGTDHASVVLANVDDYFADHTTAGHPVSSQLVRQLGTVRPRDTSTLARLDTYKDLDERWADWKNVTEVCGDLAARMVERGVR